MSRTHLSRRLTLRRSASMLGLGAVIAGALAGCGNPSALATTGVASSALASASAATATPAAAPTRAATATTTKKPTTATPASTGRFKDGEYVGDAVRADRWGNMQVRAIVQGGELVKIEIVDYPNSTRRSDLISRAALPTLISEAIENQTAQVDIVTRATDTSVAFIESLESALADAVVGTTV